MDEYVLNYQVGNFSEAHLVMEELWRDKILCDVTLKVEDKQISAHRIVLSSMIPYFKAMFTTNMKEKTQECVEIQGIDYETLEIFVNFAYTGRVAISTSNVQKLMIAASYLQLMSVQKACITFFENGFTPSNVIGIRMFADSLSCTALMDAADKYIDDHFGRISVQEEFLSLSFGDVSRLIQKDNIHVSSEEEVFEAVIRWVKHDEYERKDCLPTLLNFTRLPLLSPQYLANNVSSEPLIRYSIECRDLVDEAHMCHLLPERHQLLPSFKTHARCNTNVAGHIYVIGAMLGTLNTIVEVFDPETRTWKMNDAMRPFGIGVEIAVMSNKLYALGGLSSSKILSTIQVFEPLTHSWKRVAWMHFKRRNVGVAALNERLYVCGGCDKSQRSLNTVECYYPNINKLTIVSSMQIPRTNFGVVAFESHIYALGGRDNWSVFNSVERFDPNTEVWSYVTPMMSRRHSFGVASLNGKLYVCGGNDGIDFLSSVETFDPVSRSWKSVAPMNVKRCGLAVVANEGRLWAIGGCDGWSDFGIVEIYDPDTDSWIFAEHMCLVKGIVGAGVIQF